MEICSNICSLRDAPLSRPYSVSALLDTVSVFNSECTKIYQKKYSSDDLVTFTCLCMIPNHKKAG